MSEGKMNRETARSQMSPALLPLHDAWEKGCILAGLNMIITCVTRTPQQQLALILQGRGIEEVISFLEIKEPGAVPEIKPLIRPLIMALKDTELSPYEFCMLYRKSCGLPLISRADFAGKVTWTVNSRHFPGADQKANAFDFAIDIPGHEYDIKLDENKTAGPDFVEAGKIAQGVGLRWGGEFGDNPHVEVKR